MWGNIQEITSRLFSPIFFGLAMILPISAGAQSASDMFGTEPRLVELDLNDIAIENLTIDQMIELTRRSLETLKRTPAAHQAEYRKNIASWLARKVDERINNCNDDEALLYPNDACDRLESARRSHWKVTPEYPNGRKDGRAFAEWAWANQAGNCEENGALTYHILKEAGAEGTLRLATAASWHVFTIWGLENENALVDPRLWGSNAVIIDSWAGYAYDKDEAYNSPLLSARGLRSFYDVTDAYYQELSDDPWNLRESEPLIEPIKTPTPRNLENPARESPEDPWDEIIDGWDLPKEKAKESLSKASMTCKRVADGPLGHTCDCIRVMKNGEVRDLPGVWLVPPQKTCADIK